MGDLSRPDGAPEDHAVSTRDAACLAALLAVFVAATALAPPIFTRGEAREGLVMQSLVAGGDWVIPRREGILASKPPLFHWVAAGAATLVGDGDLAARLPSALAGWAMLVATFMLGTTLFERRRAWVAVGALAATAGFWPAAIQARVDMVFAAAIASALTGLAVWQHTGRPSGRSVLYLATAAAVLTKGPAGAVLVGAILVAALAGRRDGRSLWDVIAIGPILAAGATVLGWYGLAYRHAGWEFIEVQLVHENLSRAVGFGSFARQRRHHPFKMLEAFATWLFPWNLALFGTWRLPRTWARRFLHAWWMVTLAFFTVAAGKRSIYLLPLYPAIALLAADVLLTRLAWRPWMSVALGAWALGLATATVVGMRHDAARSTLRAFVEGVQTIVPATATVGIRGSVNENDRLVLAYRLHRPVPRVLVGKAAPDFLVVRRAEAATVAPACESRVAWPTDEGLVLVACPHGSAADEHR